MSQKNSTKFLRWGHYPDLVTCYEKTFEQRSQEVRKKDAFKGMLKILRAAHLRFFRFRKEAWSR